MIISGLFFSFFQSPVSNAQNKKIPGISQQVFFCLFQCWSLWLSVFEPLLAVSMTGDGEELGMDRMHAFVHSGSNTFFSANPLCNLAAFIHEMRF